MNGKKIITYLTICGLLSTSLLASGFRFPFFNQKTKTPSIEISQGWESVKNSVWCVTFQLVWNDFMDKFANGNPVQLVGGNPTIADELNKKLYTTDVISENSYYKVHGEINSTLKKQINKAIKKKFNEKSDVLSMVDWKAKDAYLFYVMLKKEFNFNKAFDELKPQPFANSSEKVKYFGIKKDSHYEIKNNVKVLFYNNDEYAVKLLTKENEEVILYKTNKSDDFTTLYNFIAQTSNPEKFGPDDTLKIPNIEVDKTISYDELCGKQIEGTNKKIAQAIQTIKFNLDEKGGRIKSEAIIGVVKMSLAPDNSRHFNFDDTFVLFLKEANKDKPYFATRINNTEFLVKE